jgi:predicted AAA+ superfamily ATPase
MVGNAGLAQRLLEPPRGSFFLLGVRGAGKTTWALERVRAARHFDLLDEALFLELQAEPGRFGQALAALPSGATIIVDEIQRIPALLNEVHRAIEARRQRFVLLGSSARRLKTSGTNLLAGRATVKTMFPLVPAELGREFALERVLRTGSIPVIWRAPDPTAALESYVQLYLREEIRAEAIVRNLPAFVRFLQIAGLFHGQVVNVSSLARDAAASRTTIDGYLAILEDTLVAQRLPAFEARLRTRERRHPKLFWVDPGLARAARRQLGSLTAEERGPLFEGWLLTVLRAHNEVGGVFDEIAYWAPAQARALEVDFLLTRGREYLAIEAKAGSRVRSGDVAGLQAIGDLTRVVRRILVYPGSTRLTLEKGIEAWPVAHFLDALAEDRLWP